MSGKSLAEQMDEARAAWRTVWYTFADAVIDTRGFRAFARFAAWADKRLPWLGWIDDHAPKWMRFGTHQFFEMIGTAYLIFAAGVFLGLAVDWLAHR